MEPSPSGTLPNKSSTGPFQSTTGTLSHRRGHDIAAESVNGDTNGTLKSQWDFQCHSIFPHTAVEGRKKVPVGL